MRRRSGHPSARDVDRTAEQLRDQAVDAKGAIRSGSGPDTLTKQTEAIEKEVNDVLRKIRGAPATEASADDRQLEEPSIQERVNSVASQIGNVTSPATQLQRETLELAMADLRRETARLNALLAGRVPALNSGLDAAGIPWTIGRPINITR